MAQIYVIFIQTNFVVLCKRNLSVFFTISGRIQDIGQK